MMTFAGGGGVREGLVLFLVPAFGRSVDTLQNSTRGRKADLLPTVGTASCWWEADLLGAYLFQGICKY